MNLIDLHCDTISRIQKNNALLKSNNYHISFDKLSQYDHYSQIMAIFISNKLSDEQGYNYFHEAYGYYMSQLAIHSNMATHVIDGAHISKLWSDNKYPLFLSVEDARILNNDITRLDNLYNKGVRFLILMWSGSTCIGGSHNTTEGLTDFGRQVMHRCFELGIVLDASHASEQTTSDMIEIAKQHKKPIIASHSNSYAVYPHSRNLRDSHFKAIRDLGGLVGISLCTSHLSGESSVNVDDVIKHIDHYLSLGGENIISLGCDLDGTDLPDGFKDVRDIIQIADKMSQLGYSDTLINRLFWQNAKEFFEKNIK